MKKGLWWYVALAFIIGLIVGVIIGVTYYKQITAKVIAQCGNGYCESGEDSNNCPIDCPAPAPTSVCGNGICESGEDANNCPSDCSYLGGREISG